MLKIRGKVIINIGNIIPYFLYFFTLFLLGQGDEIAIEKSRKYWKFVEKWLKTNENTIF